MRFGWLYQLKSGVLNSLFPLRCSMCGAYDTPLCASCALTLAEPQILPLHDIATSRISTLTTAGHYANPELRNAMESYKFHSVQSYAGTFGVLLAHALAPLITQLRDFDIQHHESARPILLLSVPLHKKRIKERGFDQNALIAQYCAKELAQHTPAEQIIEYIPGALLRTRYTTHQTTVETGKRAENVGDAFTLTNSEDIIRRITESHIILVDDIVTSGATLGACAIALSSTSPLSIHAAAVLRSQE